MVASSQVVALPYSFGIIAAQVIQTKRTSVHRSPAQPQLTQGPVYVNSYLAL